MTKSITGATHSQTSSLALQSRPTLSSYQDYVRKLKVERGFKDDKNKALILLVKDVGQLAQAIRYTWPTEGFAQNGEMVEIRRQLADTFIALLDVANQYQVDLEEAFRIREDENKNRQWKPYHLA